MAGRAGGTGAGALEAAFTEVLCRELKQLDIPYQRGFRIPGAEPGSPAEVDLLLPRLPRTAVEVKTRTVPPGSLPQLLAPVLARHERLAGAFGPDFITLVVLPDPGGGPEVLAQGLPPGIRIVPFPKGLGTRAAAHAAAQGIADILTRDREDRWGKVAQVAKAAALGLGVAGVPGALLGLFSYALMGGIGGLSSDEPDADRTAPGDAPSAQDPEPPSGARTARAQAISSQVQNILCLFQDLAPESHGLLEHEMARLLEEYHREHFTACALRAGRSLETIVYALSVQWGIQVRDSSSGILQEMRIKLDRLDDLLGDFQVSEGEARKRLRGTFGEETGKLSSMATSLGFSIDDSRPEAPRSDLGARSVKTLLKRIRRKYQAQAQVREMVDALLGGRGPSGAARPDVIGRIQALRHAAAHAATDGRVREVDEAQVEQLLKDIQLVVFNLANIAAAIAPLHQKAG